jgi:asparagine synthase (glutamine-hydrolysing)
MTGFAGIFSRGSQPEDELRASLRRMARSLGTDGVGGGGIGGSGAGGAERTGDQGEWIDAGAGIALADRRAASGGAAARDRPPSGFTSSRFQLVCKGEIYNSLELIGELEREGRAVCGAGSAEVIHAVFERWGIEAGVPRLGGSFAIAVWDTRERTLSLIRDRLGIEPLFVHARRGVVTFSSQLRALRAGPAFEGEVDPQALIHYLRYLYISAPRSIYRDVVKLGPGQILTITDPAAPLPPARTYWSLGEVAARGLSAPFQGTREEAATELERLLSAAISSRMLADAGASLGALLSGGIDSSTVVALLQENSARPVRTFTIAYEAAEYNEADHAARIARHLGTEHTEFMVTGQDALAVVPRLADTFDEPQADAGQIAAYLTCAMARREVDIALVGDGGDELYGGYNRYAYGASAIQQVIRVPAVMRRLAASGIDLLSSDSWARVHRTMAPLLPRTLQQRLAGEKLAKLGRLMGAEMVPQMYRTLVSAWQKPTLLVPGGREEEGTLERVLHSNFPEELVDRMMLADQLTYLPDDQLAKAERVSMAAGLRVRAPLLDHLQVEFSWRLPPAMKIDGRRGKLPLRDILYRRVPREMVERPKVGFSVPLDQWLRGPLRPWAEELLVKEALARDGLLSAAPIHAAWRRFLRGSSDSALAIWAVLVFQAWRERWLSR